MSKNKLVVIFYCCASLILVVFLMQTTCFSIFSIPTGSMLPALKSGDKVLVNKCIMGARIFNLWKAAEGQKVGIYRLPGIRTVKRNDVLVFHNPYPHSSDSLSMHLLKYYIKRCIQYLSMNSSRYIVLRLHRVLRVLFVLPSKSDEHIQRAEGEKKE